MRRLLVCTGVLGGGTALVFALAAATSMLFPQGTLVPAGWNGGGTMMFAKPGMGLTDDTLNVTVFDWGGGTTVNAVGGPVAMPAVKIEAPPDPAAP